MTDFIPDSDEEILSPDLFNDTSDMISNIPAHVDSLNYQNIPEDHNPTDDEQFIPQDILDYANEADSLLVPPTSKKVYDRTYHKFKNFMNQNKMEVISEKVLMGYFYMLARPKEKDPTKNTPKLAPKSLWSIYSMLKKTLLIYEAIDIEKFPKLTVFLSANEKQSDHVPKKAQVFTNEQIIQFLEEAPDRDYLATKVALILGTYGLCRRMELWKLTLENIEDHKTCLHFVLTKTKNGTDREFTVTGKSCEIIRKYMALRPPNYKAKPNFFLKYVKGVCHREVMGRNKLASLPKEIASYLGLENPKSYTGHSFRHTGATVAAEAGMDISTLKKLGGWKSTQCAEGYVHHSRNYKNKIASKISNAITNKNAPSSTITKDISSSPSTLSSTSWPRPSTSRDERPPLSPKRLKLNDQLHSLASTSTHRDNEVPQENNILNIPNQSNQTIQFHFQNCTNFKFFGALDKENHQ